MKPISVLIADDHKLMRVGIQKFLGQFKDIQVVGEASNGIEALEMVEKLNPDVLLLDMQMPGKDGVEVARSLTEAGSAVRCIAFSAYDDKYYVLGLLETGAAGYILKDDDPCTIIEAIRQVCRDGKIWVSARIALS